MRYLSAGVYYVCAFLALVLRGLTAFALWVIEYFWVIVGFLIVGLVFMFVLKLEASQRAEWEAYKEANRCTKVGHMTGDTHVGIATTTVNGQVSVSPVVTTTPDKTGWLCEDGVTYWR